MFLLVGMFLKQVYIYLGWDPILCLLDSFDIILLLCSSKEAKLNIFHTKGSLSSKKGILGGTCRFVQ